MTGGTGSQSNSNDDVLIVNLKVWSENFAKLTLIKMGANKIAVDPAIKKNGKISKPNKMPKRDKILPVTKNCIIIDAAPATE